MVIMAGACGCNTLQLTSADCRDHAVETRCVEASSCRVARVVQENMSTTLVHISRSADNGQLLGRSHSAKVAELMTELSHPRSRANRGKTLMLLFAALARVLWVTEPASELWGRLRHSPVCNGLPQYLCLAAIDPVAPGVAAPTRQSVVSMQTAAGLNILLVALSDGSAAESESQLTVMSAAVMNVQQWAVETLLVNQARDKLDSVVGLLLACLNDLMPYRRVIPRQRRVLAKVAAILGIGVTAADGADDADMQNVRARGLVALQSVALLMSETRVAAAAAA